MEKPRRFLVQRPEPLLLAIPGLVLLVLRDFQPRPLGQRPHGVAVAQPLNFHLEIDDTAALVAAEAVEHALVRRDGEGSGFLSVEGTQAKQVGAGTLQRHILPHHVLNRVPRDHFINKCRWKWHGLPPSSNFFTNSQP